MRNELEPSNEEALDGASWPSCFMDEEVVLHKGKPARMDEREAVESGQRILALVISIRGM
jgi:hypothetical protein